jgi:hypothetical protein
MNRRSRALPLAVSLLLLAAAPRASAIDGVYPERGEIRTEVRIEGCPYGPQPEIVHGSRGRALHARWQRDLCARRDERVLAPGWITPRIELDASDSDLVAEPTTPETP